MCMTAMLIAGTAMSALSSIQQGQAASAAADAQAQAADYNARASDINARVARRAAGAEADRTRGQNERQLASMRAAAGASGATMSGSNLGLVGDAAMQLEYDALLQRYQGEVQASAHQNRAGLDRYESATARQSGRQAMTGGIMGAGADILNGASTYSRFGGSGKKASGKGVLPGLNL